LHESVRAEHAAEQSVQDIIVNQLWSVCAHLRSRKLTVPIITKQAFDPRNQMCAANPRNGRWAHSPTNMFTLDMAG
jgi:hypothetical protein